jgi:cephalosporin hydroxylase
VPRLQGMMMIRFPDWDQAVEDRADYQLREPDDLSLLVDRFHYLYYHQADRTWAETRWLGVPVTKCPLDLWVYQELLVELKPDVVVETGTHLGGSALYFASICDLLGHGRVYSVDVRPGCDRPRHPRIGYLTGSSTNPAILADLQARIAPDESVLVVLDSDHRRAHVLAELEAYRHLVTPGSYLVVEDTNVNGHPVFPGHGPGPWEAVDEFLRRAPEFIADREREKFFLTFNPRGFLRKR